jgi:hypothetical protein
MGDKSHDAEFASTEGLTWERSKLGYGQKTPHNTTTLPYVHPTSLLGRRQRRFESATEKSTNKLSLTLGSVSSSVINGVKCVQVDFLRLVMSSFIAQTPLNSQPLSSIQMDCYFLSTTGITCQPSHRAQIHNHSALPPPLVSLFLMSIVV